MGKKNKGAASGAEAGGATPKPNSPPPLWYLDEGWRLTPCQRPPRDVLQVSCTQGRLAMVLNDGRVALCGTGQDVAAGQDITRKTKYVTLKKMKISSLECGPSSMLLVSEEGKLYEYEYKVNNLQPCLVKGLHDKHIVQVACGDHHSMALSKGGELFTWGQNMHGQLGLKFQPPRQSTPQLVEHLSGSPLAQISAGSAHSVALSLSGTVYSWGNNNAGQLGLGDKESRYLPTMIKTLERKRTVFISCGEEHTAALTKDGLVFTFGAGSHGQLGHTDTGNKLLPCLLDRLRAMRVIQVACGSHHTLAYVPSESKVYFFGAGAHGQPGDNEACQEAIELPMQVPEVDNHEDNSSQARTFKVVAGGKQSVVLSLSEKLVDRCMDMRIATIEAGMVEKWLEDGNSDWRKSKKEIKQIFSSVACVNGSFLKQRDKRSKIHPKLSGIDIASARLFFVKISNRETVLQQIGSCLKKCLIPQLSHLPPHPDALPIFLLIPECTLMYDTTDSVPLVAAFANAVNGLGHYALQILEKWWAALPHLYLYKHVNMLKKAVVTKLKSNHITEQDDLNTISILEMLEKMYKANMKANYILRIEEFYINEICTFVNLPEDVGKWQRSKKKTHSNDDPIHVIFCQYPFLLNLLAKRQMLQLDMGFKQQAVVIEAFYQLYLNKMQGSNEEPRSPMLHMRVNGATMVEDTLRVLSTTEDCDLRKQFVLEYTGGIFTLWQENLMRVYFLHVFEEMLQPDYGMFVQCDMFSPLWFPAKPSVNTKTYSLFGILCALTIFNLPSIYLPFPLALFKKLLGQHPTLEDLKELDPVKGKNLQYILDYEDDDIVDNLGICFDATWDNKTVDLIENGSDIYVDNSNKQDFVNKYVDYIFNISVATMFEKFKSGFYKVCEKAILETFQPSELMGVVVGDADYDWVKFQQIAAYDGIYAQNPSHPTIKIFWKVFHELSLPEKKQFLLFVVGNDTMPVYGMDCLKIFISSNPAFTEEHLPQAQTCYQILQLPPYSSKPILKKKLLLAISHNRGFS